jgi:hypothetical protein
MAKGLSAYLFKKTKKRKSSCNGLFSFEILWPRRAGGKVEKPARR